MKQPANIAATAADWFSEAEYLVSASAAAGLAPIAVIRAFAEFIQQTPEKSDASAVNAARIFFASTLIKKII